MLIVGKMQRAFCYEGELLFEKLVLYFLFFIAILNQVYNHQH